MTTLKTGEMEYLTGDRTFRQGRNILQSSQFADRYVLFPKVNVKTNVFPPYLVALI